MNDASHKLKPAPSSPTTRTVPNPSGFPEQNVSADTRSATSSAHNDAAAESSTPWAMIALSVIGLAVGVFAVIGPEHVSVAVAKTLLTVGCVLVAALAGVVASDLSRRR
jgi:hypothetical protein